MGRPPCCDKANVKRGLWTAEEDAKILAYVSNHGVGNWTLVPKKAGLNRCGKSCRLRWTNYLRPDLKHDDFTPHEEELIINLHQAVGSRWSLIAKQLPGRTDNDVKNFWNTKLRKKLSKMGIDPVTHKPFSQIISDYGNISGLPNTISHQIGCFSTRHSNNNNNNNNTLMLPKQPETSPNHNMILNNPMTDQVQGNSSAGTSSLSWDLLATQFQLANLNATQPYFLNEANSSCSSSSSSNITHLSSPVSSSCQLSHSQSPQANITPCSSSSWTDFLVTDPFLSSNILPRQEDYACYGTSSTMSPSTLVKDEKLQIKRGGYEDSGAFSSGQAKNYLEAASSASSFVDSILDQDNQMRSEFPELLEGSYDY